MTDEDSVEGARDEGALDLLRPGIWFDELQIGTRIRSGRRTVTEADVTLFAGLSGDYSRLHTDAVHCAATPFERPIAHGLLVQAIATGLIAQTGFLEESVQALTQMVIRWRAPVYPGDTLSAEVEVSELDASPGRVAGAVVFVARVLNQDDRVVSEGEWHTRVLRKRPGRGV